ncbi:hypothetical protein OsJ_02760 [Oryza sativa Japonica Group]|uniref:Uncharacterized protein n=1 Tax=Oryza sativa subsp. japonica TaxID=39947 RepID=B9EY94_ORYSJ|nr:hypothetical protein OsJ_02760 [Oryza sativa Japonica Group]
MGAVGSGGPWPDPPPSWLDDGVLPRWGPVCPRQSGSGRPATAGVWCCEEADARPLSAQWQPPATPTGVLTRCSGAAGACGDGGSGIAGSGCSWRRWQRGASTTSTLAALAGSGRCSRGVWAMVGCVEGGMLDFRHIWAPRLEKNFCSSSGHGRH